MLVSYEGFIWYHPIRVGLVIFLVVGSILGIGVLVTAVRGGLRSYGPEASEYEQGVLEGDEGLVRRHICDDAWNDIESLDGGFGEARQATFDALPGELDRISPKRGAQDHSVLELHFDEQDPVLHDLPIVWVDDEPHFCPDGPDRLLGSPR